MSQVAGGDGAADGDGITQEGDGDGMCQESVSETPSQECIGNIPQSITRKREYSVSFSQLTMFFATVGTDTMVTSCYCMAL